MSASQAPGVLSHWHKSYEDFQTSPLDFYTAVAAAVKRREIPGITLIRIEHKEAGLLSAKREYLRISRERLAFDICGAPFGTGYFFSWWLAKLPSETSLGCLVLLFAPGTLFFLATLLITLFGWKVGCSLGFVLVVLSLVGAIMAIRKGWLLTEEKILAFPLIGALWEIVFKPATYYRTDTVLMFQDAVHTAVLEVIDGLTTAKGLRALGPEERRPTMQSFLGRR